MVIITGRINKYKHNQFRTISLKYIVLNRNVENIQSKVYHKIYYHRRKIIQETTNYLIKKYRRILSPK